MYYISGLVEVYIQPLQYGSAVISMKLLLSETL